MHYTGLEKQIEFYVLFFTINIVVGLGNAEFL